MQWKWLCHQMNVSTDAVIPTKSKGAVVLGMVSILLPWTEQLCNTKKRKVVRWLVPEGQIFLQFGQKKVSFLFSKVCQEMQLSLNQYIKEFVARRDTPGKMAHEVRKVTESEVRLSP